MSSFDKKLKEYTHLLINFGIKVKEGYVVLIIAKAHTYDLVRLLAKEAYEAGAKNVFVYWTDDYVTYQNFKNDSLEYEHDFGELTRFVKKYKYHNGAAIYIRSEDDEYFEDLSEERKDLYSKWHENCLSIVRPGNKIPYTIAAFPAPTKVQKIFPDCSELVAWKKCYEAIFKMQRINGDGKSIEKWLKHFEELKNRCEKLNSLNLAKLHYKNSLGTDLHIELPKNHIWFASTDNKTVDGKAFVANMPTEEVFTSPLKLGTNGKVCMTLPLDFGGYLIKDAWFIFKDGKVVDYGAAEGKEAFDHLFKNCEETKYLGEAALVPYDSPISQMGRVFYDTLIDENASCHFALGNSYAKCLKGGLQMSEDEIIDNGLNIAEEHVDFMIGSADLSIVGTTVDGQEVQIMKDGNII